MRQRFAHKIKPCATLTTAKQTKLAKRVCDKYVLNLMRKRMHLITFR